jgi:ribosomal protein S12 methylthiotransferase accessory factor
MSLESYLKAASQLLDTGHCTDAASRSPAIKLLAALGYDRSNTNALENQHRQNMLLFASKYCDLFQLQSTLAPGCMFLGAVPSNVGCQELGHINQSVSFSGCGSTLQNAFQSCVGEAAEYFSQIEQPTDAFAIEKQEHELNPFYESWLQLDEPIFLTTTRDPIKETAELLPSALILRSKTVANIQKERTALSSGCAAGATLDQAATSALCEYIERDAVALWWAGGRPATEIEARDLETHGIVAALQLARTTQTERQTFFLDISTDTQMPCVACYSVDSTSRNISIGFSCNFSPLQACLSAMREMLQMELSLLLTTEKRDQRGQESLSHYEHQLLHRAQHLNTMAEPAFAKSHDRKRKFADMHTHAMMGTWIDAAKHLGKLGFQTHVKQLTRQDYRIPCAKIVITGLQPYPSTFVSDRLAKLSRKNGECSPASRGFIAL